jgi:tryptophanyl-tRNA synthetase
VEPLILGEATRVMSLRDGSRKMSKSDTSEFAYIGLEDDSDTIALKIRKARTDAEPLPSELEGLEGRPEAANLVGIYAALSRKTRAEVLGEFAGAQFSTFKPMLAELLVETLSPVSGEMRRLLDDTAHLDAILARGAERARNIAEPIIKEVRSAVGFLSI